MNELRTVRGRSDIRLIWVGADSSRWVLHGKGARTQGAWVEVVKGILDAPQTQRTRSSARQRGSTPGTVKVDERVIDLTVHLAATKTEPLDVVEARWNRACVMGVPAKIWVTTSDSARFFEVRLREQPAVDLGRDPRRRGVITIELTLVACDPDARGHDDVTDYTCNGTTQITVSNPTDLPAWLTFVLEKGTWTLPDGISGKTVPLKQATQPLVVRTNTAVEQVTMADGTPGYQLLGGRRFEHPLPPHTPPTKVPVTGTGKLQVIMERKWARAW